MGCARIPNARVEEPYQLFPHHVSSTAGNILAVVAEATDVDVLRNGRVGSVQLSRDSIIAAALEILDSFGLADMTMRRVASHLGVAPGALYWHVANKQELIAAIAARIITPALSPDPAEADPADLCRRLRRALLSHRDGAELVGAALSQPGSGTRADVEKQLAATLAPHGLDPDDRRVGAATLLHLVLGSTTLEQARRQLAEAAGGPAPKAEGDTETGVTGRGEASDGAAQDAERAEADFRRGVELCLAGLTTVAGTR